MLERLGVHGPGAAMIPIRPNGRLFGTVELGQGHPFDAAALFWWARMQLYFEQHLDQHPSVMLSRYEDLVLNPARTMRRTYAFLGRAYPGDHIVKDVNAQSVGKGRVSKLTPAVDQLCGQMLERLDRLNETAAQALEAKIERDGSPEMLTNGDSVYAG